MSKKRIPFATGGLVDTHSSGDMPKVAIDPKVLEKQKHMPTTMELLEAARIEHRKTRLEDNHPVMEFLEDIIYCPSQIEFYFRDGEQVYCLYIRQRHDRHRLHP